MIRPLLPFISKLFKPCKSLFKLLKFPFRKPVSIRFLTLRKSAKKKHKKKKIYHRRRPAKQMDDDSIVDLKSFNAELRDHAPYPSPLTPAFVMSMGARRRSAEEDDEVEEACRSFENYLAEMIVEEGMVRDLTDVEELLYCWDSLKSPLFQDLVCRFYGELCKDLFFSSRTDHH